MPHDNHHMVHPREQGGTESKQIAEDGIKRTPLVAAWQQIIGFHEPIEVGHGKIGPVIDDRVTYARRPEK